MKSTPETTLHEFVSKRFADKVQEEQILFAMKNYAEKFAIAFHTWVVLNYRRNPVWGYWNEKEEIKVYYKIEELLQIYNGKTVTKYPKPHR